MRLRDRILAQLQRTPGATDRELTNLIYGRDAGPQTVNGECRFLAQMSQIERRQREDGWIGNFILGDSKAPSEPSVASDKISATGSPVERCVSGNRSSDAILSEDEVKRSLERWLNANGWSTTIAWAKVRGIDILAIRGSQRWVIEAKGCGSLQPMRVNYFLAILGETLQRMDSEETRYSIALPDMAQFRGLWARLPALAKKRTGITLLLIGNADKVTELS
ncbi:MAG: hypothetical protein AB7J30_19495 [Hyphomicrobium sp.]|uniref:hypothetical protein n=1 Tax=Hyphomicrobium sp. TaxID=82 RepID=UPI003D120C80